MICTVCSCSNDPAFELNREGFILPQVVDEDFVESVERDAIAAGVPEEVAAGGQEIDSRLGCGGQSPSAARKAMVKETVQRKK